MGCEGNHFYVYPANGELRYLAHLAHTESTSRDAVSLSGMKLTIWGSKSY
jgi:hypothetical protein